MWPLKTPPAGWGDPNSRPDDQTSTILGVAQLPEGTFPEGTRPSALHTPAHSCLPQLFLGWAFCWERLVPSLPSPAAGSLQTPLHAQTYGQGPGLHPHLGFSFLGRERAGGRGSGPEGLPYRTP